MDDELNVDKPSDRSILRVQRIGDSYLEFELSFGNSKFYWTDNTGVSVAAALKANFPTRRSFCSTAGSRT